MNISTSQSSINKKKALARSLYNKRDFIKAGQLYLELCNESPDAESHYMMSMLYGQSSNHSLAEKHLTEALRIDPQYELAWGYLGITQASQGKYDSAIINFNKAIEINPKNTQTLNNLGNVYRDLGNLIEAEAYYKRVLQLDKSNFITINNVANIYLTQCQYDKAENYYKRAIKLNKNYFDAYYNLGATYQCKGNHKLAINYYKRAQKLKPEDINPQAAIANSYEKQGKFDKALEHLNPLLARNIITPDIADTYSKICLKNKNYDDGIKVIEKCLSMRLNLIQEQALRFCLGDLLDKQQAYDNAYKQYALANSMRPYQYNKNNSENTFSHIEQIFSNADSKHNYTSDNLSNTPIFIIGMPRSGTSLVEQILSSHSDVNGAGELPYISEISEHSFSNNAALQYPECINELTTEKLTELSNVYLTKIKTHSNSCHYISDKMPHNFMYVGLIRRLFPNCKIIHCLRSPLDVCLSVYFHNFNQNHPYSDSLDSLGHYYNQYRNLMSFWHKQYDNLIIDISYEDLLSNPEHNIRNMLQHIGIEWEDSCLKHHENKRAVSTPSYAQVTQPLYKSSMERWRNYATFIDELKNSIDNKYLNLSS